MSVYIPKTGYGLGEGILITIGLKNNTTTNITRTLISLNRVDILASQSPYERTYRLDEKVAEKQSSGVRAGEHCSFEELITVPESVAISNGKHCKVFRVTYELKVVAITDGIKMNVEANIPITIGTVGVKDQVYQNASSSSETLLQK